MVELEDNIFYLILELIRLRSFSFDIDPLLDLQAWQKIVLYELFKKIACDRRCPSCPMLWLITAMFCMHFDICLYS